MQFTDWIANLPFVNALAIAVALYAVKAWLVRAKNLPEKPRRQAYGVVDTILFAWATVVVLITPALGQSFFIPSESMVPTLEVHDHLIVGRVPFWFRGPKRGDILVFKVPPNANIEGQQQDYIKRCIGLPGETLEVRAGKVWINGKPLDEPYTAEPSRMDYGPIEIPPGHVFMMGDNRNNSADSRFWGPLDESRIVGVAFLRFWPLNKIGLLHRPTYPGIAETKTPALGWPYVSNRYVPR